MGTARETAGWNPKWWSQDKHGSTWERAKEALRRDWEQTKSDFGAKSSPDLDQDVDDTFKQAAGKDVIPPRNQPNAPGGTPLSRDRDWNDAEAPLRYGFGARQQYGSQHRDWDDNLEGTLRKEWEEGDVHSSTPWSEVRDVVRHGYERGRI